MVPFASGERPVRSVSQAQRDRLMLVAIALCFFGLGACAPSTVPAAPVPTIIASTLRPTSASTVTSPSPSTPQPIEDALASVGRALQADDASMLVPLLLDEVLLAREPGTASGELIGRDNAIAWLKARWGNQREVVSNEYIEHFALLEITTQGWAKVAPLDNGRIIFHLHRYDAQGRGDALDGQWRIDAILYQ
jgi:hypothetical protein